ncbi:MAG TPA: hypothetical protein VGM32_22790 [Rhodopila sp.]
MRRNIKSPPRLPSASIYYRSHHPQQPPVLTPAAQAHENAAFPREIEPIKKRINFDTTEVFF